MLSISQCRQYLNDEPLKDSEIVVIRDALQKLAEISIECLKVKQLSTQTTYQHNNRMVQ